MAGNDFEQNYTAHSDSSLGRNSNNKKIKRYLRRSLLLPFLIVLLFVGIIAFFALRNASNSPSASALSIDERVDIKKPKAQQALNKVLNFPLKDQTGKEVSKYTYEIQNAELRDEIIVKGQRGRAVKERTFLIINIKITNSFDRSIQLNVRDFVRLVINNSNEKIAPEIHNDPVEVQAISTKYTRIGFPIDDKKQGLKLQVGELNGKKEEIQLSLNQ